MAKQLIDEATIEAARERLSKVTYEDSVRQLRADEPDLHYAVGRYAVDALNGLEELPQGADEAAYAAVWRGVLLALEAYRLAHYRLWRGTAMGTLLEQLDPALGGDVRSDEVVDEGPDDGAAGGVS